MAGQKVLRITGLGSDPVAASATFHAEWLMHIAQVMDQGPESLVLIFELADHTHRDWQLAVVRSLARTHSPVRVNAVAGEADSVAAALLYLEAAPGITGQYLMLDSQGAGDAVASLA
ncbi:Rossmann fold domain-containing protein [Altererythrobacter sp. CAU 1778]